MSRADMLSLSRKLGLGTMAPAAPSHCGAFIEKDILADDGGKVKTSHTVATSFYANPIS